MRLRKGAFLAALALAGCASVGGNPAAPRTAATYADFLIGRTANLRDDHAAAADRYFAALARAPDDEALIEGAIRASISIGDADRARRAARMAPREGGPALAHLVRTVDALRGSQWRRVGEEVERTEGAAAEELLARMLLVWGRVGEGRVDEVLPDLAPLAAIRPYGGLFAYQQAMALDYAGRRDEALALYAQAARSGMFLPAAIERHAELLAQSGRRDEAIVLLRAANGQRNNVSLNVALARFESNAPGQARPLTPAMAAAVGLYGMGAIFLQEHDRANGLLALGLAMMLDPDFEPARLAFAEIHAGAENYSVARAALARIPAASPYASAARVSDAWVQFDAGQEEEALSALRALGDAGDLRAQRATADMYARLERHAEADVAYTQLIASESDNWRLFFARGAARERLGRWPEAEADLRRALELSPNQAEVLNYLGYTWIDRGENLEEGLAMIRRAVELRPTSGAIIDSLGWAYYRMGDYPQALLYLERAVELEPSQAVLHDHLGDVYWRLGRRVEARFAWQRALGLEPDNPEAIRAKIESGLPAVAPTRAVGR